MLSYPYATQPNKIKKNEYYAHYSSDNWRIEQVSMMIGSGNHLSATRSQAITQINADSLSIK